MTQQSVNGLAWKWFALVFLLVKSRSKVLSISEAFGKLRKGLFENRAFRLVLATMMRVEDIASYVKSTRIEKLLLDWEGVLPGVTKSDVAATTMQMPHTPFEKENVIRSLFRNKENGALHRQRTLAVTFVLFCSSCLFLYKSEKGLALRRMIAEPGRIGMLAPSSRALYELMAEEVLQGEVSEDTLIIELGPGTGIGTQVLLDQGLSPDQVLCIELDPEMQKHMKTKFPEVETVLGNAAHLEDILGDRCGKPTAIISGIPLKNLSNEQATAIIKACHAVLRPQGKMAQFTYGFRPTQMVPGFQRSFGGFVLGNLPPAWVWTLTKVK